MSQQDLDLPDIDWLRLRDTILASSIYALKEVNNWSTRHPYVTAGALICISGNPELLLTPLRLARYIYFLPFRLILWPFKLSERFALYIFGFRGKGVAKDSLASRYQSNHYGGYVPRDSTFARFQSYGATDHYDEIEAAMSKEADEELRMRLEDALDHNDIAEALRIRSMEADEARRIRLMDAGNYENRDLEEGLMLAVAVSGLSAIGAGFVLGRTWGWWK